MFKQFLRAACALSVLGFAATATAADSSSSSEKVSPDVGKPLSDAITALQKKDYQTALTDIHTAQAATDRTAFDDYRINQILTQVEFGLQDMAGADVAAEAAADSTVIPDEDKKGILANALLLSAQQKHWPKSVTYGQELDALNALDDSTAADYAVALYNTGDQAKALQYAQKSIDMAKAAGKAPDQAAQEIVMNSQAKSNPAAAAQVLESIVAQGGSPQDWQRLIDYTFGTPGMDQTMAMNLYRLGYITHSIRPDDVAIAGRMANQLGYFGDAVNILESSGSHGGDLSQARASAAKDRASLSSQIAEAKHSSGQVAVKVAEGLYGYGRYAEAEDLARYAMQKGGVKIPAEASMLVGMSLVGEGKYADAVQAFNAVSGNQAAMKTAHLWSLYAQSKSGGAAGAQPQQ